MGKSEPGPHMVVVQEAVRTGKHEQPPSDQLGLLDGLTYSNELGAAIGVDPRSIGPEPSRCPCAKQVKHGLRDLPVAAWVEHVVDRAESVAGNPESENL